MPTLRKTLHLVTRCLWKCLCHCVLSFLIIGDLTGCGGGYAATPRQSVQLSPDTCMILRNGPKASANLEGWRRSICEHRNCQGQQKAAYSLRVGRFYPSNYMPYQRLLERLLDWRCCWKQSEQ